MSEFLRGRSENDLVDVELFRLSDHEGGDAHEAVCRNADFAHEILVGLLDVRLADMLQQLGLDRPR